MPKVGPRRLPKSIKKLIKMEIWASVRPVGVPLDPRITKMVSWAPKKEPQGLQNYSFGCQKWFISGVIQSSVACWRGAGGRGEALRYLYMYVYMYTCTYATKANWYWIDRRLWGGGYLLETSLIPLELNRPHWNLPVFLRTRWNSLELLRIKWNALKLTGARWIWMEMNGIHWNSIELTGTWNRLEFDGARSNLKSLLVFIATHRNSPGLPGTLKEPLEIS